MKVGKKRQLIVLTKVFSMSNIINQVTKKLKITIIGTVQNAHVDHDEPVIIIGVPLLFSRSENIKIEMQ